MTSIIRPSTLVICSSGFPLVLENCWWSALPMDLTASISNGSSLGILLSLYLLLAMTAVFLQLSFCLTLASDCFFQHQVLVNL